MEKKKLILSIVTAAVIAIFCSCNRYPDRVEDALKLAGENREELECVLDHFKNDTLKYQAACFLIANMPYRFTFEGRATEAENTAYLEMADYPKEQRANIYRNRVKDINYSSARISFDLLSLKADFLIKAINDACNIWRESPWSKEYGLALFFDYVLPYRLLNEPVSDWREAVKKNFPNLTDGKVYSKRGMQMETENMSLTACKASNKVGASNGKYVLLTSPNSRIAMDITVPVQEEKAISFCYTASKRNTKATLNVNGVFVDTLYFEPTVDMNTFKVSRNNVEVSLRAGINHISIGCVGDSLGMDYLQICAIEKYDRAKTVDYSSSYCRIRNMENGYYITFDTLRSSILNIMNVKPFLKNDSTQILRMNYMGYPCWTISAFRNDTTNLCMEVQYVRTSPNAPISQYNFINGDNQKWVVIPIGEGLCKIMSKDTGLFLDIKNNDDDNGIILVQNPYKEKKSQKWKIEQIGKNPFSCNYFPFGSAMSEGLRIYDVMNKFEWISASTGAAPRASSLIAARTGNCRDEASYTVFLCRSLGIPAAVDFTPHWGNRSQSHEWGVIILPDGKSTPFYMGCTPGDTAHYFHSYLKPKILRHRFQINRRIVNDLKNEESVPQLFFMPDFIDVTDEYYATTDVTRDIPVGCKDKKIAYICVFDNREWVPVHYGNIKGGKVTFTKMGRKIMYMTAFYVKGKIVPFGNPFFIQNDGTIRDVIANDKKTCTLKLTRKYPFMGKEDFFNLRMIGGKFQGSNVSDFSQSVDLLVFKDVTNGNWYEYPITNSGRYRYLRYIGPNNSYCNINELVFFDERGDSVKGEIIGTQGVDWGSKEKVFDGNILTGFQGNSPDGHWVGLKLKKPTRISKLRFIPRNDGNCIEIGNKYELLYWGNGIWKRLAVMKADSNILVFRNIPSRGLYVLRNLTKGHEERIFTYEKGRQILW